VDARVLLAERLADDPMIRDVLARWDRWGQDLQQPCDQLYPGTDVVARLIEIIAAGHRDRSKALRDRDRHRVLEPDWFQRSDALGYVAYADRFAGDLSGVASRIDYLRDLGVTYLHLMPLLQPRPGNSDGGYAVMDYDTIREDLGTMADLESLATDLHESGIALTLDLVLNHVAYEHAWAQAARDGDPTYRDYFLTFADRTMPDAYEHTLRDVFPEFAPGNFSWDDDLNAWVWTTFNAFQWDLNWANPDVLCEFARIVVNLANHGVDCLRLDAIVYLWKRMGTACTNQPEVHMITQVLRTVARIAAPSMIFKAEAIVGPSDVITYLGVGEHAGKVSDLAYHNSFMVQVWSALATRDARLLAHALNTLPDPPTTTAWATYLRCHDDIGWAITDDQTAALGWNGDSHRAFLSDFYVGQHPASFAEGMTFQHNKINGDRRVSGTAASLAGLGLAETPEAVDIAVNRMLCGYAMVLGLGGLPLLYMGDELALLNDDNYADEPAHADDNRWIHRPKMPWELVANPGASDSATARVNAGLRRLLAARRETPALHAAVATRVEVPSRPEAALFVRHHPAGELVQVYNVADYSVSIPVSDIDRFVPGARFDVISGAEVVGHDGWLDLRPYEVLWLTAGA
jgi:amylosucrase